MLGKNSRGVKLTSHLHRVPRLRIGGAVPPFPNCLFKSYCLNKQRSCLLCCGMLGGIHWYFGTDVSVKHISLIFQGHVIRPLEDGIYIFSRNVGNQLLTTLRNIPEERRHLHCDSSVISREAEEKSQKCCEQQHRIKLAPDHVRGQPLVLVV